MSGSTHYVSVCSHGYVVTQCRCPSRDKTIRYVSCSATHDAASAPPYPTQLAAITQAGIISSETVASVTQAFFDDGSKRYYESLVDSPYASHKVVPYSVGEFCTACWHDGQHNTPATHKVGEESGPPNVHNLTAYLCCTHTQLILGSCR